MHAALTGRVARRALRTLLPVGSVALRGMRRACHRLQQPQRRPVPSPASGHRRQLHAATAAAAAKIAATASATAATTATAAVFFTSGPARPRTYCPGDTWAILGCPVCCKRPAAGCLVATARQAARQAAR
eukprot:356621-Chlamydomonas_euryale.AAC.10